MPTLHLCPYSECKVAIWLVYRGGAGSLEEGYTATTTILIKIWAFGIVVKEKVLSFLTSVGIFWSDASDSENPIEDDDDEEEDEEDEDDLEVKEENGVWVLNDENFDNFVADKDTVLLEFYAPW